MNHALVVVPFLQPRSREVRVLGNEGMMRPGLEPAAGICRFRRLSGVEQRCHAQTSQVTSQDEILETISPNCIGYLYTEYYMYISPWRQAVYI